MPGLRILVVYVGRAFLVASEVAFLTPFFLAIYTFAWYPLETVLLFLLGPVLSVTLFVPGVLICWLTHDE